MAYFYYSAFSIDRLCGEVVYYLQRYRIISVKLVFAGTKSFNLLSIYSNRLSPVWVHYKYLVFTIPHLSIFYFEVSLRCFWLFLYVVMYVFLCCSPHRIPFISFSIIRLHFIQINKITIKCSNSALKDGGCLR